MLVQFGSYVYGRSPQSSLANEQEVWLPTRRCRLSDEQEISQQEPAAEVPSPCSAVQSLTWKRLEETWTRRSGSVGDDGLQRPTYSLRRGGRGQARANGSASRSLGGDRKTTKRRARVEHVKQHKEASSKQLQTSQSACHQDPSPWSLH